MPRMAAEAGCAAMAGTAAGIAAGTGPVETCVGASVGVRRRRMASHKGFEYRTAPRADRRDVRLRGSERGGAGQRRGGEEECAGHVFGACAGGARSTRAVRGLYAMWPSPRSAAARPDPATLQRGRIRLRSRHATRAVRGLYAMWPSHRSPALGGRRGWQHSVIAGERYEEGARDIAQICSGHGYQSDGKSQVQTLRDCGVRWTGHSQAAAYCSL